MAAPDTLFSGVEHLRSVIETPGAIVIVMDRDGRIVSFNRGAERLLKSRRREWIGQPGRKLFAHPAHEGKMTRLLRRHGEVLNFETSARARDGTRIPITLNVTRLLDARARAYGTVAVAADISRRVRLARELDRISRTDPLTGLWNRRQFFESLRGYLPRGGRRTSLSMLYLDVDRFKQLNDRKGHLAGDDALTDIASRLRALLPGPETLAYRYGGDEFVALLPDTDVAQAMLQAEKIRRTYARAHPGGPTVSIGVTQMRALDRERDLIARADEAMYVAKRAGGNRVEVL